MKPVFICGCDRSGTTLLGSLLGSHSDCLAIPEFQFKIEILKFYNDNNYVKLENVLQKIIKNKRFKIWQLDIKSSVITEKIENEPIKIINFLVNQYGYNLGKTNYKLWIDHTPNNNRYATTLFNYFPEAKIIHIVRDGRAVASSVMPLDWGPNTIKKAAPWWVERVGYGLAAEILLDKHQIMRVRYEDLVAEPEITLKRINSFLRIDYQSEMIEGKGFKVPTYTVSQHNLVGNKPDKTRLKAWERSLTPREIQIFESLTGDFLAYLGYTLKQDIIPINLTRFERINLDFQEIYMSQINKIRERYRFYKAFH